MLGPDGLLPPALPVTTLGGSDGLEAGVSTGGMVTAVANRDDAQRAVSDYTLAALRKTDDTHDIRHYAEKTRRATRMRSRPPRRQPDRAHVDRLRQTGELEAAKPPPKDVVAFVREGAQMSGSGGVGGRDWLVRMRGLYTSLEAFPPDMSRTRRRNKEAFTADELSAVYAALLRSLPEEPEDWPFKVRLRVLVVCFAGFTGDALA